MEGREHCADKRIQCSRAVTDLDVGAHDVEGLIIGNAIIASVRFAVEPRKVSKAKFGIRNNKAGEVADHIQSDLLCVTIF